jgi:predicted aldo/keto reductase-like oxidoreductase
MEPVKGGSLAQLPEEAAVYLKELGDRSQASYAIRFAAGFEGVVSVLSGMGNEEMLRDNMASLKDFSPLDEKEREAVAKVVDYFKSLDLVSCTACRYCTDGCPAGIPIPDVFSCYNKYNALKGWNSKYYYSVATHEKGKAKDCLKCGACEAICPQHLDIIKNLEKASDVFDKKES